MILIDDLNRNKWEKLLIKTTLLCYISGLLSLALLLAIIALFIPGINGSFSDIPMYIRIVCLLADGLLYLIYDTTSTLSTEIYKSLTNYDNNIEDEN